MTDKKPPDTVVQAGGQAAIGIVEGLKQQPMLLVVVLLNICMVGAAAWFLAKQEEHRHVERSSIVKLLENCLSQPTAKPTSADLPITWPVPLAPLASLAPLTPPDKSAGFQRPENNLSGPD